MQVIEAIARDIGLVNNLKNAYCSKFGFNLSSEQKLRNHKMLESMVATNDQGDSYSLAELQELSVSNPAIRRAELMVRIKGFELVANQLGHTSGFFTVTTPSKMHAFGTNGRRNPKYDGTNPKEANTYLANVWSLIRSSLARKGVRVYGFRVAEPHHDGTPHWHFLLFYKKSSEESIQAVMQHYAMAEDRHETGASKHRYKFEPIDPTKGSAAAYVAKYISKNIDGYSLDQDLYGNDSKRAAKSICEWASIWGIRQFQQIGGPSVTVWRELRRLETEEEGVLEEARKAADSTDWAAYVMAMGGPSLPSSDRPIKPAMWVEDEDRSLVLDVDTGEIVKAPVTKFGSTPRGKVFGLIFNGKYHLTRFFRWKLDFFHTPKVASEFSLSNVSLANMQRENSLAPLDLDLCQ